VAASAALLALLVGLFPGVVLRGEVPCERDLTTLHWPLRTVYLRLVDSGGWPPAWNPLEDNGQPFAANPQHAALHPLTWLFHLLPFAAAFSLQLLLPLLGTAAAMLLLLRTLGLGRIAALYGAVVWGLGGWVLSLSNLPPLLLTATPLPAILAFALRIRRGGRPADAVGLAVSLALACAGGEPLSLAAAAIALAVVAFAPRSLVMRGGEPAAPRPGSRARSRGRARTPDGRRGAAARGATRRPQRARRPAARRRGDGVVAAAGAPGRAVRAARRRGVGNRRPEPVLDAGAVPRADGAARSTSACCCRRSPSRGSGARPWPGSRSPAAG
jgi:hypothetical protein